MQMFKPYIGLKLVTCATMWSIRVDFCSQILFYKFVWDNLRLPILHLVGLC